MISGAAHRGIDWVALFGGETLMAGNILWEALKIAAFNGLSVTIDTNAFWGKTELSIERIFAKLNSYGLLFLEYGSILTVAISVDEHHSPNIPLDYVANILLAHKSLPDPHFRISIGTFTSKGSENALVYLKEKCEQQSGIFALEVQDPLCDPRKTFLYLAETHEFKPCHGSKALDTEDLEIQCLYPSCELISDSPLGFSKIDVNASFGGKYSVGPLEPLRLVEIQKRSYIQAINGGANILSSLQASGEVVDVTKEYPDTRLFHRLTVSPQGLAYPSSTLIPLQPDLGVDVAACADIEEVIQEIREKWSQYRDVTGIYRSLSDEISYISYA